MMPAQKIIILTFWKMLILFVYWVSSLMVGVFLAAIFDFGITGILITGLCFIPILIWHEKREEPDSSLYKIISFPYAKYRKNQQSLKKD